MDGLIEVGRLNDFKQDTDQGLIEVENPNFLADLQAKQAQQNLQTVKRMDPDAEARRIDLSRKTGLPWSLVQSREQAIREQSELPDLHNYKTYGQKTVRYYQDLQNAAISKDDANALFNLERTVNSAKPELTIGRVLGRFWNDLKKSISDRAAGNVAASERFDPANREDVLRYYHMLNSVEKAETYKLVSEYLNQGIEQEEAESKAMADRLQYHIDYWSNLRDLEALEESEEFRESTGFIEDVAGGIGGSILGIGTTAANPFIGVADIYQQMYGAKAEELKKAGVDPKLAEEAAKISATGQTPLEFAGNLVGLRFLKKAFKPGSTKEFLVTLLESAAAEGLEEYAQTFPDEYANTVAVNPDATDAELLQKFVEDIPDIATSEEAWYSAAIGATIGALFPTAGRVTGGTLNLIDRQIETAQFNAKLDQFIVAAEASKTKERAPERLKSFLDDIGASETAYITPDGAQLLFQSDPDILNQIADTPELAQQAALEGHDVKIDTGKFLAFLTPEQQELVKSDLKPAPSAPSLREIENTDLSEELAKDEDYYAEVIEAEKTFRDELNRLNKQVVESGYSKQYADDFTQIVERFADRMGLEGLDKKEFARKITVHQLPLQQEKPSKVKEFFQKAVGLVKPKKEKIYYQDGTLNTESEAFKNWSERAELIENPQGYQFEPGKPVVAKTWHGTTHEFEIVNADLSNPESHFGKGFYSSTSSYDVEQNYEGVGPDLTSRLEQEKERIFQELEDDQYAYSSELEEETLEKLENNEISIDDAALEIAQKRLIGAHGEGGAALELYVKMKNPIVLTPDGGTRIEGGPDMDYYKEIAENEIDKDEYVEEDGDFDEDGYNDALDEKARDIYYEDHNPEEVGNLSLLKEGIIDAAREFNADGNQIWAELQEQLDLYDDSYVTAQEVFDALRKMDSVAYLDDPETGGSANTEFLRTVIQNMGYDGIIMDADHANQNWNMNIPGGTWHFINWEPNNIKSVENTGEFSLTDDNIYRQDQKRASVQISDEKYLVSLFEGKRDLSSLMHETGHIFLNELHSLAVTDNATDQLKSDYDSVRKWLKLAPGQQIEREHHEQFAKGFEAYLMEGKAPTTDLIPVFQRFKNWLMSVYQSARDLGVELNDEVRGVFDRMFIARQEVFRSAQQNNMQMLTKAEMDALGVVADDRLYLERLHRKALDDAEEALHRDRNRNRRNLVKLWRTMAGKQFDEDPVNRFVKFLSDGAGISKVDLEETFGTEMASLLFRKRVPPIIKADGMGVNEATVQGGFHNPDDMVRALMNIQKKESFVKAYLEKEEIEHDARYRPEDYIADTEAYSDFLEIKNKYLSRSQGVPAETTPWRAFKQHAKQSLQVKPVRDAIAHHVYMGAHSKYTNTEKSKIRQGKLGEAATANEYARLNYEMSKQAVKNRKFMERTESRVKRLLNSKSIHPDSLYQIIDLAGRFGLVPRRAGENLEQTLERLREKIPQEDQMSISDWAAGKIENAYDIELPDFVLNSAMVKNYKDLKFSDFEQLAEVFQILKTVDQQERYYNALGERIAIDTAVDELEQKMFSTMTPKVLKTLSPNTAKAALSNLNAAHTKMEFLLRKLDGGEVTGTWWEYLFKPIADAEAAREDRLKEVRKKLTSKELFGRFSGYDLEGMFHKPIFTEEMPLKMTKNQVLATALNVGTVDNRKKLQEGYGWTDEQLDAILDNLTNEDWQFVQNVWDYVNTFKKDSFDVAKEMTGKRPEEVKATPVQTKFGESRGGYYPLVYDSKLSFSSFLHEQATDLKGLFRKAHASANTRPGSHHARQASAGGQKVKLDVSVISDHLFEVVHDITHRKAVVNISKLLRNRQLQKSLTSTIGIDMQSQLIDWLHDVAQEKAHPSDTFHRLLRWARTGTTVMNMGLKATTMMTQFVGYTQTIDELGIKQAAKGLNMFYGGGSDYTKIGERIDFVLEKSGLMRNRLNSHDRDIRDALKNLAPGSKYQAKVQRFSFLGIGLFQMGVDLPTWYGAYDLAYKKFSDLPADKIDQKAVDYADSVVRMTQSAGGTKDLAKIQRGDEAMRLFTMFYGYFNTLYNLAALRTSSVKKVKDVGALAASALWLWFLPSLLAEGIAGRGPEDDEAWGEWALPILAMHPFQTVVGVRDVANAAFGKYGYQITPAQAAPKEITEFLNIGKALEEGDKKKAGVQAAESLGYIMKWPMKQVIITTGNIYDYATGKDPDFEIRDLFYRKQKHRR